MLRPVIRRLIRLLVLLRRSSSVLLLILLRSLSLLSCSTVLSVLRFAKVDLVAEDFDSVVLRAVVVGVIIIAELPFNDDHAAFGEVAAHEFRCASPGDAVDKVSLLIAVFALRPVDRDPEPADGDIRLRLPELRICAESAHKDRSVHHADVSLLSCNPEYIW